MRSAAAANAPRLIWVSTIGFDLVRDSGYHAAIGATGMSTAPTDSKVKSCRLKLELSMQPQERHREYLQRRQRESAERASTVTDPGIARIHRQFANQYAERLRELTPSR